LPAQPQDLGPESEGKGDDLHPEDLRPGVVAELVDEDERRDEDDEIEKIHREYYLPAQRGPGRRGLILAAPFGMSSREFQIAQAPGTRTAGRVSNRVCVSAAYPRPRRGLVPSVGGANAATRTVGPAARAASVASIHSTPGRL